MLASSLGPILALTKTKGTSQAIAQATIPTLIADAAGFAKALKASATDWRREDQGRMSININVSRILSVS